MSVESKFRAACTKVEATNKRNSKCRNDRDLISCVSCDIYDECQSNDWKALVARKNKLGEGLSDSWEIEKKIRNDYR